MVSGGNPYGKSQVVLSCEEAEKVNNRRKLSVVTFAVLLCAVLLWGAETKRELTKILWPQARIAKAMKDVEKQKTDGLISEKRLQEKVAMLKARRAGTFIPTMLSDTNPPLNLLRNAGFEEFNRNTRKNMSRWEWWGGWAWPETAPYLNDRETRPEYVKQGKLSARFQCTGKPARTGVSQGIPIVQGATGYEMTIWARGEGDNRLHIAFEAGAKGSFSRKIGPKWEKITITGVPEKGATKFTLWIYARGGGTIWLDQARMLPLGVEIKE
jgi:hypothetical protein